MMKLAKLYTVSFRMVIIKLQEEKSYHVSPHVATKFFEPTSHTHQHVGSCVTGIIRIQTVSLAM